MVPVASSHIRLAILKSMGYHYTPSLESSGKEEKYDSLTEEGADGDDGGGSRSVVSDCL